MKKKRNSSGFTLIEIIVVVVILSVLLAVAVPAVMTYLKEADEQKYVATAKAGYDAAITGVVKMQAGLTNYQTYSAMLKDIVENNDEFAKKADKNVKAKIVSIALSSTSDSDEDADKYEVYYGWASSKKDTEKRFDPKHIASCQIIYELEKDKKYMYVTIYPNKTTSVIYRRSHNGQGKDDWYDGND